METVIWLVGLALPVAALLFLFGYSKGLIDTSAIDNWGTGFDDGWNDGWERGFDAGYMCGIQDRRKNKELLKEYDGSYL